MDADAVYESMVEMYQNFDALVDTVNADKMRIAEVLNKVIAHNAALIAMLIENGVIDEVKLYQKAAELQAKLDARIHV